MKAEELKEFVENMEALRSNIVYRRWELDKEIYNLATSLSAIGYNKDLCDMLMTLYNDIESIDTSELVKLEVFGEWKND